MDNSQTADLQEVREGGNSPWKWVPEGRGKTSPNKGHLTILDLPPHERPREKMIERGPTGLKDKELLAILLRTGNAGHNAIELTDQILKKYPLKKLLSFSARDFMGVKGVDAGKACTILAAFELTKRALKVEDNNLPTINSARDAVAQLQELRTANPPTLKLRRARKEHKVTRACPPKPEGRRREVFKPAIDHLAASIIVAHNHPSGGAEPSAVDLDLTKRLKEVGRLVGIEIMDHLIITEDNFKSTI